MSLHPYAFKWRPRLYAGLVVMMLRHMRKAKELDINIANTVSQIKKIEDKREEIKKGISGDKKAIAKSIRRQIEKLEKKINKWVNDFCKDVKSELKEFTEAEIDDYSLLYRGSRYLRHLSMMLVRSKKLNAGTRKALKEGIEAEMSDAERKAAVLELQAKHLERGGVSTVAIAQLSPFGNSWIERRVRMNAIEVGALHRRLQNEKGMNQFKDFSKELNDVYEMGKDTSILMKRLKATFNSLRSNLNQIGLNLPVINQTQFIFVKTFRKIEKLGKRLNIEINDQANEMRRDLRDA